MTQDVKRVWNDEAPRQLALALAAIADAGTMQNVLRDLLTEKEIAEISARLEAARLLAAGEKYAAIVARTQLSSRTVARISDWLQNGCGGYEAALQTLGAHHGHLPPARAA